MKRTLSLILAFLILASSVVSCGQNGNSETKPAETVSETIAEETDSGDTTLSETIPSESPAPELSYDADTVTENGIAKAHIVLFEGASDAEKTAADELVYHIKLVSGADISVTNAVTEDSLPIIIATPDSFPELEELFPEDLAWLRDTGDGAKVRWGDDGFSIRQKDGKLYIFGATPRGTLNGVYDFIEDNMGVLWIRATDMSEYPIIYDEMATIDVIKVNYREKSPFSMRGWGGSGSSATYLLHSRNKLNTRTQHATNEFMAGHNIVNWITSSPSYDPNCYEYWETDPDGNHDTSYDLATWPQKQVNFWSDITMQCVADSVLAYLDQSYSTGVDPEFTHYIGISLMDTTGVSVYPEMTEPFEYEPGKFIEPTDSAYISTVYFTFINKIAKQVAEKYPNAVIHSYAYLLTVNPPVCDLEENVYATLCTISEDLSTNIDNPNKIDAYKDYQALIGWAEKTSKVQVYNYYGCQVALSFFTRPIWYRIQSDLQFYAANGFNGLIPEGIGDNKKENWDSVFSTFIYNERTEPYLSNDYAWSMNELTFWLYAKLSWNPDEDVDALIEYFCDKVYGDASEHMKEYYRLLSKSWEIGGETMNEEFNKVFLWWTGLEVIYDYFLDIDVDGVHILTAIQETLHKAYDAADEQGKSHIRYMMENYDRYEYLTWGD